MNRKLLLFTLLLFFIFFKNSLSQSETEYNELFGFSDDSKQDFSEIDKYVINLKFNKNISEKEIVELIIKKSTTNIEKARAIFVWIAENIAYDTSYKVTSPEQSLKHRKGVCQAYSELFKKFGEVAGLEVVVIPGDAKQFNYKKSSDLSNEGHAWNAFKCNNQKWILLDATWGAGYVNNGKFNKQFNDFWFDVSPKIYIFTHFPTDENHQFLEKPISRNDFLRIPPLSPLLITWSFYTDELFNYYVNKNNKGFPDVFSVDVNWKIIKMPITPKLHRGNTYEFIFEIPENNEVAVIINEKEWHFAEKNEMRQTIIINPEKKGKVMVTVKLQNGKYAGVFGYTVE